MEERKDKYKSYFIQLKDHLTEESVKLRLDRRRSDTNTMSKSKI